MCLDSETPLSGLRIAMFLSVVVVAVAGLLGGVHRVHPDGHRTLPEGPPQDPLQRREPSPAGCPWEIQELQVGSCCFQSRFLISINVIVIQAPCMLY